MAGERYGFDELGLEHIIGIIQSANVASRQVAEKVGLSLRGETSRRGWRSGLARDRPLEPGSKELTGWNVDPLASFVLRPGPGGCLL